MAHTEFQAFKVPDKELLEAFNNIASHIGEPNAQLNCSLGEQHNQPFNAEITQLESDESFQDILSVNGSLFSSLSVSFPSINNASINVTRNSTSDIVRVNFNNQAPRDLVAKLIAACHNFIRAYERTESMDKVLGDELAEFYRRREESLLRLEQLSQQLIDKNEAYRRSLDEEANQLRSSFEEEHRNQMENLESEYSKKNEALVSREQALESRLKDLDDRNSKHARRQIRGDLKEALAQRAQEFSLTEKTNRKRLPIHVLFVSLVIISIYFLMQTLIVTAEIDKAMVWWQPLKLAFGAFAVAASIVFYIKWNDAWFRQHADEEFRLKRLELDIDRASWVVEMALEWKDEEGREIPDHLIDRLTDNLFVNDSKLDASNHPSEDIASALISASQGVSVKIPGIGEVAIDRKGINKLKKDLAKENG